MNIQDTIKMLAILATFLISGMSLANAAKTTALASIALSPLLPSMIAGSVQQFTAFPLDKLGYTINVTLTWTSSNTTVGTINSTGAFTSLIAGTTNVSVLSEDVVNSTVIIVIAKPPVLTTISVLPTTPLIATNSTRQFTATTLDQYGAPIVSTVNWNSSNITVGAINASTGILTSIAAGTTVITASNGAVNGSTVATVSALPPVLTTINVLPFLPSIIIRATLQFTASTIDQYGYSIASAINWSSNNNSVGSIDSTGFFTSLSIGTITITAANGAVNNSTVAKVIAVPDTVVPITNATAITSSTVYTFGTWTNSYVNITLSCADTNIPASGCNSTLYCTDTNNNCTPINVYLKPIQILTQGTSYVRYNSKDNAGNSETVSNQTIRIDTSGPTVVMLSPTNTTFTTSIPPLNFTTNDVVSGVDSSKCAYSIDSLANATIQNCSNITLPSMINGVHTLVVYSSDMAGNIGSSLISFYTNSSTMQGSIIIIKNTVGGDDTFVFTINGPNTSAQIVTTVSGTGSFVASVSNGTYSVSETVPSGWALTESNCTTFNLTAGSVTCVFTNTKIVTTSNVNYAPPPLNNFPASIPPAKPVNTLNKTTTAKPIATSIVNKTENSINANNTPSITQLNTTINQTQPQTAQIDGPTGLALLASDVSYLSVALMAIGSSILIIWKRKEITSKLSNQTK